MWNTDNFKDAILLAANLADDADSVAATAGQIAGTLYGVTGMPEEWVKTIAWSEHIQHLAQQLFENPDGNLTEKQVRFAKTIHSCGDDLIQLINDMKRLKKKYGIVTACVGGGQGIAGIIENID